MLFWPSGRVCWEANTYLIWLRKQGRQTPSVNTYASEISLFIRFLARAELTFLEVRDDTLIDFADWLQMRNRSSGRHINRILLRAIDMLQWLQRIVVRSNLVDEVGKGAQVGVTVSYVKKDGFLRRHFRHAAMLPSESRRVVRPTSMDVLNSLLAACENSAQSSFCVSRNRAIVVLLADSGIRREELVWVTCADVVNALQEGGRLQIRTSKKSGNPKRVVPLPEATLQHLTNHLEVHRALQIRRIKRNNPTFNDEGWAFCTRTGSQMAPATVTQLFGDLRTRAKISERATAHMLRHRYITLQIVHRLKQLRGSRSIGVEAMSTILSRVASLTGHARLSSLWTYVDWAYDEMAATAASPQQIDEAIRSVHEVINRCETDGDSRTLILLKKIEATLRSTDSSLIAVQSVTAHSFRHAN